VEVKLNAFLTSALGRDELHFPVSLRLEKEPPVPIIWKTGYYSPDLWVLPFDTVF